MENSTLFPREEKAELLFEKILKDPEACRRLTETFYESMDADTDIERLRQEFVIDMPFMGNFGFDF